MSTPSNFSDLVGVFMQLIRAALPVLAGLALLVFLWGLVKFIFNISKDEKGLQEGKNLMIWGLIALFILVSFLTIIDIVHDDLGFGPFAPMPFLPPKRF
jgi:hypothetical protein